MSKQPRYQVLSGGDSNGQWINCKKAVPQPSRWLHFELRDGTNGLARPGRWRERPPKEHKS